MDVIDRQDEEDDFRGIDEPSRAEIGFVGREILRVLMGKKCLVVFHNGSDNTIELNDLGIPQQDQWFVFGSKVLWTFRGRLRLNPGISEEVDTSHLEIVEECCLYLLSLNCQGGNIMDYNWATNSSNYWVCDGIIQGGDGDEAWEAAAALHQHINIDDYSANALPSFGHKLKAPPKRWLMSKESSVVHPESTSFFLAAVASGSDPPLRPLPNGLFHLSDKLCVIKLCRCTFSFSLPPFCGCRSLRFLGLDSCKNQQVLEEGKQDRPPMKFFQSLWVLSICHTD
ncbi:unnamed protein product [Triticum turgidum subsp. durum]|uniref:Uncharacterized protein n=1 Tax=Triticum turgidum subsp. durum TaxID=4567 RepID=A0A9R1NFU5_TRITD|nr:unnamed protein product [Triticum turgidum subsp. durum]